MHVTFVFIAFVVLLLLSVPVSATLTMASLTPTLIDPNFTISTEYVIRAMFGGIDSFPLLAVPMFVLSGILMSKGGVSKKLFDVFSYFLGKKRQACLVRLLSLVFSMGQLVVVHQQR